MTILHGDCVALLATLPANSVDACVTDPPYGIGFMGKEWDTFKPGEEAKRIVVNRAIDSDNPNLKGRTRGPASSPSAVEYDYSVKGLRQFQAWTEVWAREVLRVLKPGAHIVVCGAPRAYHRMASGLEDAGFEIRDCLAWLFGSGFPKSLNLGEGLGTALKPAHEPIVLARKPFKGSVTANVGEYGTGALNIDACRIQYQDEADYEAAQGGNSGSDARQQDGWGYSGNKAQSEKITPIGRWPANVVIDDLAALVIDEQSGELTSGSFDGGRSSDKFRNTYGTFKGAQGERQYEGNSGGASRFYYVAKPSRGERDFGIYDLPPRTTEQTVNRRADSAGVQNPRAGAGRGAGAPIYGCARCGLNLQGGRAVTACSDGGEHERVITGYGGPVRNFHPTVKPVELMRWLVRLVTPIGGIVIDPFLGSGTTAMACRYEQRQCIGIEREAEYIAIAERRIAAVAPLFSVGMGA